MRVVPYHAPVTREPTTPNGAGLAPQSSLRSAWGFLQKAVFHAHTDASKDCRMSPTTLIERCLDEGVDVLAVTDHNEISGAWAVRRQAPFHVIVGEEIRCAEGGEIIGLFLSRKIERDLPALSVIADIRAQGGLVYLPHPFDPVRRKQWPRGFVETMLREADIVEVFNARNMFLSANAKAAEAARLLGKIPCAGADAHLPSEIGRTAVYLRPFTTPAELLVHLRSAQLVCKRNPPWVLAAARWTALLKQLS